MSFGFIAAGLGASTATAVGIGAATVGTALSVKGAKDAAKTQAQGSRDAAQTIADQQEKSEALLGPYASGGIPSYERQQALSGALGAEAQEGAYGDYRESPGVAWAREQGLRGINQQASATGGLGGGNRLKRLTEYSQGLALQDFNNYFNRLGSVTGVGLNAAQAQAGVGGQAAAGQAQAQQNAGLAMAQGQLGASQAYSSGLADLYGGIAQSPWGQKKGLPGSTPNT